MSKKSSPRKVKGVGSYLSNVVSNVSESVKNTGRSVFAPNSKKTQNARSQYVAKVRASKPRSKVVKRKLRSMHAKKVRKTRSDKGVKRGPRKTM
jgi:hypothetical protein